MHQNKNREEVKNREIMYLPDLSIVNLLSDFVLVQRILNYYPIYPINRLYFGEVETPFRLHYCREVKKRLQIQKRLYVVLHEVLLLVEEVAVVKRC